MPAMSAFMVVILAGLGGSFAASPEQAPKPAGGSVRNLSSAELKGMLDRKDFLFVNVHIPYEGEIGQTDQFIPFDTVEQQLHLFPPQKDARIVPYCMSGRMSGIAVNTLLQRGYSNVSHLEGGMLSWQKVGYPLKNFKPAR
jgi:rhodanese-related sulfurtransferase